MAPKPLKPQHFQILLALSGGDLHGYGIQRAVLDQTDETVRLWPATLYGSLSRLEDRGLIDRSEGPSDAPDDERRQYYRLTAAGRIRLAEEAERMARWVAAAREAGR